MNEKKRLHLKPIDGIRFLAALWVVISHVSPPIQINWSTIKSIVTLASNGAWAVIIFFVISGLCIHLPYAQDKKMNFISFYLARFSRIAIPMTVAIIISLLSKNGFDSLDGILWSLYCELAYYAMYPWLLKIFPKLSIGKCIALSIIPAAILTAFPDQHLGLFWAYGFVGTTILGLPIWLTGCLLAEKISAGKNIEILNNKFILNGLRLTVFFIGILTMALEFHSPIKYKYSFLVCTPVIYYWLFAELNQKVMGRILTFLRPLGAASYSLYLTHKLLLPLFTYFGVSPDLSYFNWGLYFIAMSAFCALFYFLIEKPSHRLASYFGRFQFPKVA